jgi:hypothetical protein
LLELFSYIVTKRCVVCCLCTQLVCGTMFFFFEKVYATMWSLCLIWLTCYNSSLHQWDCTSNHIITLHAVISEYKIKVKRQNLNYSGSLGPNFFLLLVSNTIISPFYDSTPPAPATRLVNLVRFIRSHGKYSFNTLVNMILYENITLFW